MSESIQKRDNNNSIQKAQDGYKYIPNYAYTNEDNGLDPKRIISLFLRYKWFVLLFLIAGATSAWFYTDYITPVYDSQGTLLITPDMSRSKDLSQIVSQATGFGTSSSLENELQILQSRRFSTLIAQKIIKEDPGTINEFPILWSEDEEGKIYRASEDNVTSRIRSNLQVRQPDEKSEIVEVHFQSSSPVEAAKIVNEAMQMYVETSTKQNRLAADSTARFLERQREKLKNKLEASEERLRRYRNTTGIVKVDQQATGLVHQRENVETELQKVNLDLQSIGKSISNYEDQLEKIKPGLSEQFAEAIGPRIKSSQEELAGYENEKMLIISKNPGVLDRDPLPPRLQYLDKQINRQKEEIKRLSNKLFTNDNEFMGIDGNKRANLVTDIQNKLIELRIQQSLKRSRRDVLQKQKSKLNTEFNSLPQGMMQLAKLQRDVRINEELYINVSKQYADMSVLKQSQFGNGRIIDRGNVPSYPVSPNRKIILLLGLMLGGVLSVGFIAVIEFMDNSIKDADQLGTMYVPTLSLSIIPSYQKVSKKEKKKFSVGNGTIPEEMVLLYNHSSTMAESIRRLKNNIIYQHGDTPPQTITITSPEKGDGKSTIAANLGVAFAEEGYKTLIIGADFRRPKIQSYFGLKNKSGLADYLDNRASLKQIIQNTEIKTLKVVTAGERIQRPEFIANDGAFKQFIKKMENVFDLIIVDTPPFGIISDSMAVLKYAESTLVVARYRKTNRGLLLRTIEELGRIQANVTGVVLNDFDHKKQLSHYYGSGYYQALYDNYDDYVK